MGGSTRPGSAGGLTTIITLLEEVVVEKRLRATEEVRITKRRTTPAGRRSMSRYDARRRLWSASM
jgi:hypothetical protein